MKGIVLAGGLGSWLLPLTKCTNKHLLPVYNEPMIYFPIRTLVNAGIREIMLVTGGQNAGEFLRLLGNGEAFGLRRLNYAYQLGERDIRHAVEEYSGKSDGAHIILKQVSDPNRFGVPVFDNGGDKPRILRIEE